MVPINDDRPTPPDTQPTDARITEEDLAALDAERLDEVTEGRLRARLALDPTAASRLVALRAGVRLTDEQRSELERRFDAHPALTAEDLEMSDEAATRIAAAIDAEVACPPTPPD